MTTTHSSTKKAHMEVQRALIDKEFDRYVLSTSGVEKQLVALPSAVLVPLAATHTVRKAQWDARVHFNALVVDPFTSTASSSSSSASDCAKSIAYYISAEYELMQVIFSKYDGVHVHKLFQLPVNTNTRKDENVSLQVAGRGLLVYSDGHGAFMFLRTENDPLDGAAATWRLLYECCPLGHDVGTLLLSATFDGAAQRFYVVATELMEYNDKDAVYRLHVVDVFSANAATESDTPVVGLQHAATEIAVLSTLPSFVAFTADGSELQVLIEGKYELAVESVAAAELPAASVSAPAAANDATHVLHKRHHEDGDVDSDLADVLTKLPRAGIGYHGDIADVKHAQELALDLSVPLDTRFHKSSTPFSSLDVPLHSVPLDAVARNAAAAREGRTLEVPTTESILSGFEECDDVDPNATAVLLCVCVAAALSSSSAVAVREALEINCRKFRFLCPSARLLQQQVPTLLFQHDVHGLVYSVRDSVDKDASLVHQATLPAFGFVQASKQQKKFLTVHPTGAFACIGEFDKRVFVYHGATAASDGVGDDDEAMDERHTRKQHVIELGDHQLLGMCVAGNSAVLVLTPHHVAALTW